MAALPPPLEEAIRALTKLPGVGEKTAMRLTFYLLRAEADEVERLAHALLDLRRSTRLCSQCLGFTTEDPCRLCQDPSRDAELICVVERPADVVAVERSGGFKGRYHVLHGALSPLDGVGPEQLRIRELVERLQSGVVREVILACNPTAEGEATALYLAKLIKPLGVRVSRIAHGLPMGADVEYADGMTLTKAIEGRREL
ncbi:MAG: recombination protein RecR [Candidatus Binatia bacterium]|nr:MAG: recombination protein RecR [Candidatus Binatia bacterium]